MSALLLAAKAAQRAVATLRCDAEVSKVVKPLEARLTTFQALLLLAKAAQRAVATLRCDAEVGTSVPLLKEMQAFSAPQKSNADSQRPTFA